MMFFLKFLAIKTFYIHLHTLQVEDEKFVQICGKSLLWHADSSKSSDYLPLSYQSHFQFHLDHILSSYPILTTKLQYLICSSETRENILSESDHNYNTAGFIKIPGLIFNISLPILCLNSIQTFIISCNQFQNYMFKSLSLY